VVETTCGVNKVDINQTCDADTLLIATGAPSIVDDRRNSVEVSHWRGTPGFVNMLENQKILSPDYPGNNFFNTLGNLMVDSRVCLLFPDFEAGDTLTLEWTCRSFYR